MLNAHNISKTTLNFAAKRNIDIFVLDSDNEGQMLVLSPISPAGDIDSSSVGFKIIEDGTELVCAGVWDKSLSLIKISISDEKTLRSVIDQVSEETTMWDDFQE